MTDTEFKGQKQPMGIRMRIAETGETGTVVTHEPGVDCLLRLDDGTPRVVGPKEIVQILLPNWSLEPAAYRSTA